MMKETNKEYVAIDLDNELWDVLTEKGVSDLRYWEKKDGVIVYDFVLEAYY